MIPMQALALKEEGHNDRKYSQRNHFLNNLQLYERKRTSVDVGAQPVCRYLKAIFEECYTPGEKDYEYQRPAIGYMHILEFEMTVPCEGHADIGTYQKQYCPETLYHI